MSAFFSGLPNLIVTYGSFAVGVTIALESMGLPLPGEAVLIAAAIYAGTTGELSIEWIVFFAAVGAVVGDNVGYLIGRSAGFRLMRKFGPRVGVTAARIKLGRYLFDRHGGKVVFFGRFVAILRILAALLAGVNQMPWMRFFVYNLTGGVLWASGFGFGAYFFGQATRLITGPLGVGLLVLGALVCLVGYLRLRRQEARWTLEAEARYPGAI